jgi:hypothetical protein
VLIFQTNHGLRRMKISLNLPPLPMTSSAERNCIQKIDVPRTPLSEGYNFHR